MSTSYKITGTIRAITETKQVSDRFSKREIVLDVEDGKYPQVVALEVHNDRCAEVDRFKVGQEVTAEFNVRGREWKSPSGEVKYFTTLAAWKFEATTGVGDAPAAPRGGAHESAPASGGYGGTVAAGSADADDIPFASSAMHHETSPIARVIR